MSGNPERDPLSRLTLHERGQCLSFAERELRRLEKLPSMPLDLYEQWQMIMEDLRGPWRRRQVVIPVRHSPASVRELNRGSDNAQRHKVETLLLAGRIISGGNTVDDGERVDGQDTAEPSHLAGASPSHVHGSLPRSAKQLSELDRLGQYVFLMHLGAGSISKVYLARDIKLGRDVAIKVLRKTERQWYKEWFLQVAQATARCVHENIVTIYHVDEYHGHLFMVCEYLEGKTLRRHLDDGPPPPHRAVQLMVPVVRALVCAHEHNIVHQNLKPENIILTTSGIIKVLDFGLSFEDGGEPKGQIFGTRPYMSPEQWVGETVDHHTDLWAVGIMLYIMVVGQHPLSLWGQELRHAVTNLDQPMPSAHDAGVAMPPALADLIDHCLKKRREERIPTAEKLLSELERIISDAPGRKLGVGEIPYTGLQTFQETDAHRFFGRSREIVELLERLKTSPIVVLAGPSGVGKSSFMRAGVLAALKRSGEKWETVVICPGRNPLTVLAKMAVSMVGSSSPSSTGSETGDSTDINTGMPSTTDRDDMSELQTHLQRLLRESWSVSDLLCNHAHKRGHKLLLFIDQFEELYTLTDDVKERRAFIDCLACMAIDTKPLRIVISIRSDFLADATADRYLGHERERDVYHLGPSDRDALREAIVLPVEMAGYHFETEHMVQHMIDTLVSTSDALSLLQVAATRLWETRDHERRLLTEESYRRMGGVTGALAAHADTVFASLTPWAQSLTRTIFLQLVTPERTRGIASMNELRAQVKAPAEIEHLVDCLADARLLMVRRSDPDAGVTVELVHDVLIDSWPTLRSWLEEEQADCTYLEQLRVNAERWDRRGRPSRLMLRGEAAGVAQRWYHRYRGRLTAVQEAYLTAVPAQAATRRKRLLVVSTMILLLLLALAAMGPSC